jgi:hypothetical protein
LDTETFTPVTGFFSETPLLFAWSCTETMIEFSESAALATPGAENMRSEPTTIAKARAKAKMRDFELFVSVTASPNFVCF